MLTRRQILAALAGVAVASRTGAAADSYRGPVPPKKDVPYLLHADNLIETEVINASESSQKKDVTFSVPGATSPARTPLAEPIFLFASDHITPDSLSLYQFDVKNGHREIKIPRSKGGVKSFHTSLRTLAPGLFRIEAAEYLENGEYALSPEGQNIAFCFTVF
jgi:hypothetical protein